MLSDSPPAALQPAAPALDERPVQALLTPVTSPPQPTLPIDRDRWFVEQQNGRRTGPLTWPELLGCVKAKMFFADDLAYGEVNAHQLYLRDLFPTLAVRAPVPVQNGSLPVMQQLATNPASTIVLGPETSPYQKQYAAHGAAHLWIVGGLAIFYLVAWSAAWAAVFLAFGPQQRDFAAGATVLAGILLGLGLLNFSGALLEWEFIFNLRKVRWWRAWYGDAFARKYLLGLSWVPMGAGLAIILIILSVAWS